MPLPYLKNFCRLTYWVLLTSALENERSSPEPRSQFHRIVILCVFFFFNSLLLFFENGRLPLIVCGNSSRHPSLTHESEKSLSYCGWLLLSFRYYFFPLSFLSSSFSVSTPPNTCNADDKNCEETFSLTQTSSESEESVKERACDTLIMCIVTTLNQGLRNGGGIGDVLRRPSLKENMFVGRVIYDLLFFFVVIIIVLNLIFGVIIDTFADLRSEKQNKEEVLKNTCFICGKWPRLLLESDRFSNWVLTRVACVFFFHARYCFCIGFWLVHCLLCICCDWLDAIIYVLVFRHSLQTSLVCSISLSCWYACVWLQKSYSPRFPLEE